MNHKDNAIEQGNSQAGQEPRDSFCIYPFRSMNVMPNGEVKPCCAFNRPIGKDGRPMSVYEHALEEIWNSADMRDIRQAMVEGRPVQGCSYCYDQENRGLRSMWSIQTENWALGVLNPALDTIEQLKASTRVDHYEIPNGPEWFDLDMGNLCNLQCRMCNASYSSRIANDPIQSHWTGLPQVPIRWQGKNAVIAPRQMLGVLYEGFQYPDYVDGVPLTWTDGNAAVRLDTRNLDVAKLSIRLRCKKHPTELITITANREILFHGSLIDQSTQLEFETPFLKGASELEIRIVSPVVSHLDGPPVGVGVEEIRLIRPSSGSSSIPLSRLPGGLQWFQEQGFLTGELLGHPDKVRKVNLIGGEPLLIKEVRDIMRHFIATDSARNVVLVVTTNGTCCDDEWLDLASKFAGVYVAISVDGFGPVNEYIRFPSQWRKIEENVAKFKSLSNAIVDINMTVQAYNVLDIVDLVNFCDRAGVGFRGHFLQYPNHLSPLTLPFEIRQVAAERLRDLAKNCAATTRNLPAPLQSARNLSTPLEETLLELASALESGPRDVDADLLRRFMLFTNDLDAVRGQSFASAFLELKELIERAGFPWVKDLIFAA